MGKRESKRRYVKIAYSQVEYYNSSRPLGNSDLEQCAGKLKEAVGVCSRVIIFKYHGCFRVLINCLYSRSSHIQLVSRKSPPDQGMSPPRVVFFCYILGSYAVQSSISRCINCVLL